MANYSPQEYFLNGTPIPFFIFFTGEQMFTIISL